MKRYNFILALFLVLFMCATAWAGIGGTTNVLGENTADNAYNSDTVAANADGSILERLEYIQTEAVVDAADVVDITERAVSKTVTTIMNGNNNLFAVAGGPIKILELVAYVTTEIEGKSCLINYNIDPTAPATDTAFGTDGTALEINGDAVGTLYTWDGVIANDLTATTNGVALGVAAYSGLIVPAGSIELAAVVATSATGAITVYMRYIPLASGVTVTAAE